MKNPVLLISYKRLDLVEKSMERIRQYQPDRLYLASDGGKDPADRKQVQAVRDYLDHAVDWTCQVYTRYSDVNQGCKYGPYNAISWMFEQEEQGIILEDDIIPGQDFWRFCDTMLEYYKDNDRVLVISGCNELPGYQTDDSYVFSKYPSYWGWATWKRAWNLMDIEMKNLPKLIQEDFFRKNFRRDTAISLQRTLWEVYERDSDAWDYQWMLAGIVNDALGVVPRESLVENMGFDRTDGTHTGSNFWGITLGVMDDVIRHPERIAATEEYEKQYEKRYFKIHHFNEFIKNHFPKRIVAVLKNIYWKLHN